VPRKPEPFALEFDPDALREWKRLDNSVKQPFRKKLEKLVRREITPAPHDRLRSLGTDWYKIKLRRIGYRLIYQYQEERLVIYVVAAGRRAGDEVYEMAVRRVTRRSGS